MRATPAIFAARHLWLRCLFVMVAAIWIAALINIYAQHERDSRALRVVAADIAAGAAESGASQLRSIDAGLLYVRSLHARQRETVDLQAWVNSVEAASGRAWPIAIADAEGLLTLQDLRPVSTRVDVSQLQPFRHFAEADRDQPDDRLFIATSAPSRTEEAASIRFARPLMTPFGRFDGMVMLTLDARALLPAPALAAGAAVTVIGPDSAVLAQRDGLEPSRMSMTSGGSFVRATRRVDGSPLSMEVTLPDDPAVIGLNADHWQVAGVALALSVVVMFAGLRSHRAVAAPPTDRAPATGETAEPGPASLGPVAAASPPTPATTHIALDHLSDAVGTGAVAGVVAGFLGGLPRQLARMHALATTGETETLLREAHALASRAAAIGLDQLAAAAGELEQHARHDAASAIAARLDRIDLLARRATDRLDDYLHAARATNDGAIPLAALHLPAHLTT